MSTAPDSVDYKATVFLPRTDFPMRAGLPQQEPQHLARWEAMDLYARLREASKGREKFVLHDGPPYANGHLHLGHALNKILKDVIVRAQQMLGKDANYVPGWDCHGLPIEWKIEEKYRAEGRDKDAVPVAEFRQECRSFAQQWIGVQKEEFKRLGVLGDWKNPYTTMAYAAEAAIVGELCRFVTNGGLYRGAKPVMWSVVEKTALAEAEVEYHDHTSTMIWVRFPVIATAFDSLKGASIVIWTTTPWTMPGNRAVAYGPTIDYALMTVTALAEGSLAHVGESLVVAAGLVEAVAKAGKISGFETRSVSGHDLAGTVLAHPWRGLGYDFPVPLLAGDHVTAEDGTGFVHTAPGHGVEDYEVSLANGIAVPETVAGDGTYYSHVPLFAGHHVYKVAPAIVAKLTEVGALLATAKLVHSYPHSWRSKAPLIYRTTPQWFISMDTNELRAKALKAIDDTRWIPSQGRNRLFAMVESRPDWCVSRQRAWGVPITVFVHKQSGAVLRDTAVLDRIAAAVLAEGADAWFTSPASRFLGEEYDAADYEQVFDILDVWFDSGATHAYVLEQRPDLKWPADLYLEGSDQHRGWFHSSLLESCGTRGRAPYEAVLTHGFILDEQGRKMSKSLGNTVVPQQVIDDYGADILRLWVVASDYNADLRVGPDILKQMADQYRRLRNTLRFLLGALDGFSDHEILAAHAMPELERWVLHRLSGLDSLVRQSAEAYDFHTLFAELTTFCTVDLSAFYFDVRKDSLYCDDPASLTRRSVRTVMDIVFRSLTTWLAPFLPFTAEEAWLSRYGNADQRSIHLELFPTLPTDWHDPALAARWQTLRALRRVVTGALEVARANKVIGASLQAHPVVWAPAEVVALAQDPAVAFSDVVITSGLTLLTETVPEGVFSLPEAPAMGVRVDLAVGEKCQRCWKVLRSVGRHPIHIGVCDRCAEVVSHVQ